MKKNRGKTDLIDELTEKLSICTPLLSLLYARNKAIPYDKGRCYKGNIMEIFSETISISRTSSATAGGVDKVLKEEVATKYLRIKRSIESAMISGVKKEEYQNSGRQMNGLLNMVDKENIINASNRGLGEDVIVEALKKLSENKTNKGELFLLCNGVIKRKIRKTFEDLKNSKIELVHGNLKIEITVLKISTDYGYVTAISSTDIPSNTILIFNLDLIEIAELQEPIIEKLASTGNSDRWLMVAENTISADPKGIVKILNVE